MSPSAVSNGIGIADLPNQRHKIVAKRGTNFTLMVVGKYSLLSDGESSPEHLHFSKQMLLLENMFYPQLISETLI
jgi:hypothetical protein